LPPGAVPVGAVRALDPTPIAERQRGRQAKLVLDAFNEVVIVAAALVDEQARERALKRVTPDMFAADRHQAIWAAIAECHRRKLSPEPATLRQLGGESVDEQYLLGLMAERPAAPANLSHHLDAIEWDAARLRAAAGPVDSFVQALTDPAADPERVKSLARQIPASLDGYGERHYIYEPGQLVRAQMDEIRGRRKGTACFPYGLPGFDRDANGIWRIVPGAKPKMITLVTALSGSGKSLVTGLIANEQRKLRRKVLYGAWETDGPMTAELIATSDLGWSKYKLSTGQLTEEEEGIFEKKLCEISAWVRFWKFPWERQSGASRPKTNDEVLDRIHGYVADSGADVVVFDLWRRCLVDRRLDAEEAALERMQDMAKDTCAHFILCHQQRLKDVEQRKDRRPTREAIKGTSMWVDISDTILGIHLPSLWKPVPDNVLEIDVLKQRFGRWPIAVEFDYSPDQGRISNAREVDYNPPGTGEREDGLAAWVNAD
jgi:hypothetical protein